MSPDQRQDQQIRRIAVIAIHGVGDHPPFATAREIGDLLSDLNYGPSGMPRYAPFTETIQRVNVRPVKVTPSPDFPVGGTDGRSTQWGPLDAIAQAAYERGAAPETSLDHLFMEGQLDQYKGEKPEDTYELLRLEGRRVGPMPPNNEMRPEVAEDSAGGVVQELREHGVGMPQDETRRREATGSPTASPGTQEKMVHIYEMYWADLSRLGNAFTQIFSELYQLLFHLASLGVNNVKAAAIHFQGKPGAREWRSLDKWQSRAAAILAWPAPILNLFMAALVPPIVVVSLMRRHLSSAQEFVALVALVGLLAAIACGAWLFKCGLLITRNKTNSFSRFVTPPALIALFALAAASLPFFDLTLDREWTESACAALVTAIDLIGVGLIVKAYDKQRPGSLRQLKRIGLILLLFTAVVGALGGWTFLRAHEYYAIVACMNLIEIAFWYLSATWIVFYFVYIINYCAGIRAVGAVKKDDRVDFDRARRTRWTARLLLALPSSALAVLILIAWAAIVQVAVPWLPGHELMQDANPNTCPPRIVCHMEQPKAGGACGANCTAVQYTPAAWQLRYDLGYGQDQSGSDSAETWIYQNVMKDAGITLLPILLGAMLVALLIAMWGLAPVVWDELYPPGTADKQDLRTESTSLGLWLSEGFKLMRVSGRIMYVAMFIPLGLIVLTCFPYYARFSTHHPMLVMQITKIAGTLVVGAAVGLFGFSGRLKSLALGFRPAVRVMLDVDNWLREHPRDSNPTARICGRYASLLRHVANWRDPLNREKGYQALVIVAHSQGTVITADLLRFLQAEKTRMKPGEVYDPELARLGTGEVPIYLFTMGCPLRQLYGLRFPYLYAWARGVEKEPVNYKPPDLNSNDTPDPSTLGIAQWVNAFRSGDYVGRSLWRQDESTYRWDPISNEIPDDWDPVAGKPEKISADRNGTRIEFCIGPGAHTHYWDHTAALIAQTLDRLINAA